MRPHLQEGRNPQKWRFGLTHGNLYTRCKRIMWQCQPREKRHSGWVKLGLKLGVFAVHAASLTIKICPRGFKPWMVPEPMKTDYFFHKENMSWKNN